MATAAKAFGLKCIDMVCVNYKEEDILREECEEARRLGYDGKVKSLYFPDLPDITHSIPFTPHTHNQQAIHPNQVQIIQSTFIPTEKGHFQTNPPNLIRID
ncbi:hypothetical protein FRC12_002348 [Ceratobasidium sp. 428]|nr:hypothetical protein FRC12_002348 [Ceratobasidium sp. 428]